MLFHSVFLALVDSILSIPMQMSSAHYLEFIH